MISAFADEQAAVLVSAELVQVSLEQEREYRRAGNGADLSYGPVLELSFVALLARIRPGSAGELQIADPQVDRLVGVNNGNEWMKAAK